MRDMHGGYVICACVCVCVREIFRQLLFDDGVHVSRYYATVDDKLILFLLFSQRMSF